MSTDPSTPGPGEPSEASAPPPNTADPSAADSFAPSFGQSSGPPPGQPSEPASIPARKSSGPVARLLTVLYALAVTPVASILVVHGGLAWQQYLMMRLGAFSELLTYLFSPSGLPTLLALVGGLLLLASVVATGLASSAGLLSVSLLTLLPMSQYFWPQVSYLVYENFPELLRQATLVLLMEGVAMLLYPVMGGLGLALVIARRWPRPPLALSLPAAALLPLGMLAGTLLVMYGQAVISTVYAMTFGAEGVPVIGLVAVVGGVVLLWLSCAATGASRFALILPVLVTIAATACVAIPALFMALPDFLFTPTGNTTMSVLVMGGGAALAVVMLVHIAVQFAVSSRARRRLRAQAAA